jgi:hypothetical protein
MATAIPFSFYYASRYYKTQSSFRALGKGPMHMDMGIRLFIIELFLSPQQGKAYHPN